VPVVALVVLVDCERAKANESGQSRPWCQHPYALEWSDVITVISYAAIGATRRGPTK
jgi:hypothetical protein